VCVVVVCEWIGKVQVMSDVGVVFFMMGVELLEWRIGDTL